MPQVTDWRDHSKLHEAARLLHRGGVVACPTEALWGLSCDPYHEAAVERILQLKNRERGMGLILIAASIEQLGPYLKNLTEAQLSILRDSWPGPYTWLVPDNGIAPPWVTGGRCTLALRVTDHPVAAALCEVFGGPLVSTSANPHGLPAATTAVQVKSYFNDRLDAVLPGAVGENRRATSIRDLATGAIIRA